MGSVALADGWACGAGRRCEAPYPPVDRDMIDVNATLRQHEAFVRVVARVGFEPT